MTSNYNDSPVVLLLDKSPEDRTTTKVQLEANGYHVFEAESVFAALDAMSDFTLDCRPSYVFLNSEKLPTTRSETIQLLRGFDEFQGVPIYDDLESLPILSEDLTHTFAQAV